MANAPAWLFGYYGKEAMDSLHPDVVMEGEKVAVVRLHSYKTGKNFTAVGFVLIKKYGHHNVTEQRSLLEGPPTIAEYKKIKTIFETEDSK